MLSFSIVQVLIKNLGRRSDHLGWPLKQEEGVLSLGNLVGDITRMLFGLAVECHVSEENKAIFGEIFFCFLSLNRCFLVAGSAFL